MPNRRDALHHRDRPPPQTTRGDSPMKSLFKLGALAAACLFATASYAADWSDTELQLLHGTQFRDNGNDAEFAKSILTLQHASGWKYGRNFFFVDMLKSDAKDNRYGEVYGEFYTTLSTSKIAGYDWSKNFLKDIGITAGINYGSKNSTFGPNPKIYLLGPTFDLSVPGFNFLNVDVLAYHDTSTFSGFGGGYSCGEVKTTYQVTPSWQLPFSIGSAKFSFEGFMDVIGSHGSCKQQVLTQPQLRWDVGNHFGTPGKVYLGIEYQYWKNKFGIDGRTEHFPQALLVWKL
jgi:nucleoside-specific outer membrane channel protein Tsx